MENKQHGKLLTIWLLLMLVGSAVSALIYLFLNSSIAAVYPNVPSWIFYIYGALATANVIFVVFLFKWKKWALFAFYGNAIVAFMLNLMLGFGMAISVLGLSGPVILYFLLRSRWSLLDARVGVPEEKLKQPGTHRKRWLVILMIVIALVLVAGLNPVRYFAPNEDSADPNTKLEYFNEIYGYKIAYPANYQLVDFRYVEDLENAQYLLDLTARERNYVGRIKALD